MVNLIKCNPKERCDSIRAMELLVRSVNYEPYIGIWLSEGVADGDIDDDTPDECLNDYIEDDRFAELMETFLEVMAKAYKNGGLYINGVQSL